MIASYSWPSARVPVSAVIQVARLLLCAMGWLAYVVFLAFIEVVLRPITAVLHALEQFDVTAREPASAPPGGAGQPFFFLVKCPISRFQVKKNYVPLRNGK